MDEGFEVLTLIQTGKSIPMPVVMVDAPGGNFWKQWDRYVRGALLGKGLISEEDLSPLQGHRQRGRGHARRSRISTATTTPSAITGMT